MARSVPGTLILTPCRLGGQYRILLAPVSWMQISERITFWRRHSAKNSHEAYRLNSEMFRWSPGPRPRCAVAGWTVRPRRTASCRARRAPPPTAPGGGGEPPSRRAAPPPDGPAPPHPPSGEANPDCPAGSCPWRQLLWRPVYRPDAEFDLASCQSIVTICASPLEPQTLTHCSITNRFWRF